MDTHVRIAGWLWIIFGALGFLITFCLGATIAFGGIVSQDETAILVTSILALVCGGFFLLENALNIIAGVGLLKYKNWGRILSIILGILSLFNLPIGTALGIYTLWVVFNSETMQLFDGGSAISEFD